MHRNCCVCFVKLFQKSVSDHFSVDFLEKGRVLRFYLPFREFTLFSYITFRLMSSFSFQLADLSLLFIFVLCFNAGKSYGVKGPLNETAKD